MTENAGARVVRIGGRDWVIGADWSAPSFSNKPSNLYALARTERFDPEATLAAYMRDEFQIGWYVFSDPSIRPGKTAALASVMREQLARRTTDEIRFPLTAVMNLGECYWLIIFDSNRNIVPGFERWGTSEEIYSYLDDPEYAGTIEAFRECLVQRDDEQAALDWLFEGIGSNVIFAEPVRPSTAVVRNAVLAAGALVLILAGGHFLLSNMHARHDAEQRARLAEMLAQQQRQRQEIATKKKLEQSEFNQRLEDYWGTYPRPWLGAVSQTALIDSCRNSLSAELPIVDGWERVSASCRPSGSELAVTEDWSRGKLATVFEMPEQASFAAGGDKAETQKMVPLDRLVNMPAPTLGDVSSLELHWIGTGQRYGDVIKTVVGTFSAFIPPVPNWVPKSRVKEVQAESPVLWHQEQVKISSAFAPWDGWPLPQSPTFLVGSVTVKYSDSGSQWTLEGVQYAH